MIGLWICPGTWPYTFHEHKRVTNSSIRSLIHILLIRLYSYLINSFTMLDICLRVLSSEGERKTKHRMQKQNSRKNRVLARASTSPLERSLKACKSTGCMKNALELEMGARAEGLSTKAPRSSVEYPARADTNSAKSAGGTILPLEHLFLRSSGHQKSGFSKLSSWAPIRISTNKTCMLWLKSQIYTY